MTSPKETAASKRPGPGGSTSLMYLCRGLAVLREHLGQSDLPAQLAHLYLEVAVAGEIPLATLAKRCGVGPVSASRLVFSLAQGAPGKPGRGFLEIFEDPYDRRFKIVRITPHGRAMADRIVRDLQGGKDE